MEQFFCVLLGVCLLIIGIVLTRLQPPDWTSKHLDDAQQRKVNACSRLQRIARWINNRLISVIGGLIVVTAAIPHGRNWMVVWSAIFSLLLLCIFLAMVDALSSIWAYRRTLPATIRATLGEDTKHL